MPELQIKFAQIDPAAKADITSLTVNSEKPWSNTDDLKRDSLPPPENYAAPELNYWMLDGTFKVFPDDPPDGTWGWWSDVMSGEDGEFEQPPTLDISFAANHKSRGLTLCFYPHTNDFADRVRATWYNSAGAIIKIGVYTLTSNIGVIREPAENFRRVTLEMLSTPKPFRYIKLFALDYGVVRVLEDGEIDTCSILEEIDPTVESISINTMNARVRTRDGFFNPVSGKDADEMMMQRQVLTVTRSGVPFGTFFLESWEDVNQSGIVFDFDSCDATGVLDLYTFMGGMYDNALASDILTEIFGVAFPTGLIKYNLDPAFALSRITGWLPICSCGEALQHICFALHAIADTARIGDIWIYPRDTETTFSIPLEKQYRKGSIKPTDYYSGVDVISYSYTAGVEVLEVYNDILPAGMHRIEFSEPLHTLTVTGAEAITKHVNYVLIDAAAAGNVTISGRKYIKNTLVHSIRSEVAAGEVESVKRYENYTLVSPGAGEGLAGRLFYYLQNRLQMESGIVLDDIEVGYIANMSTGGRSIKGTITSLDINLRANKAAAIIVGNTEAAP